MIIDRVSNIFSLLYLSLMRIGKGSPYSYTASLVAGRALRKYLDSVRLIFTYNEGRYTLLAPKAA
jgi:hypothetical protein